MEGTKPELEGLVADTRRRLTEMGRSLEHAQALMARVVERLDRSEERFARLQARRLPRISAKGVERDRILLRIPDEDLLERTMVREIDRRAVDGWAVAGIVYDPHDPTRVEIDLQRSRSVD